MRREGICRTCGESCVYSQGAWVHRDEAVDNLPAGVHKVLPEFYDDLDDPFDDEPNFEYHPGVDGPR